MTTTTKKVPVSACRLRDVGQFELMAAADPAQPSQVKREWAMLANTGATMQRWWGSMVLDLSGATFSQRLPLLMDHAIDQRLGYSTKVERTARGIEARGKLLQNDLAQTVLNESSQGFPFQASLMAVPTRIQELDVGAEATVNGQTMTGPLTIFREWTMRELTLTVLGADGATATEAFAGDGAGEIEVLTMTTQSPAATAATLNAPQVPPVQPQAPAQQPNPEQLATDRVRAERERSAEILRNCAPEQMPLGQKLINDGAPVQEALAAILKDTRSRLIPPASASLASGNGGNVAPVGEAARLAAMPNGEAKWKAEFANSEELQAEFSNEAVFLAWKRGEQRNGTAAHGEKLTSNLRGLSPRNVIGTFYKGLEEASTALWVPKLATSIDSNQEVEIVKFLGDTPKLREKASNNTKTTLKQSGLTITNKAFSAIIEVDADDVRRDKTGQIMVRVGELSKRAAQLPQQLISSLIVANGNAYDNVAFFHATNHITQNGDVVANAISYDATATNALTSSEATAAVMKAIQQILGFKDDAGEPRNEFAESFMVMCPINLFDGLLAAIRNDFVTNGVTNTLKASGFTVELKANARLTATDKFFVFRTDSDIKPFIWQDEVMPVMSSRTPENSDKGFLEDVHLYKARRVCNAALGRFDQACQVTLT